MGRSAAPWPGPRGPRREAVAHELVDGDERALLLEEGEPRLPVLRSIGEISIAKIIYIPLN